MNPTVYLVVMAGFVIAVFVTGSLVLLFKRCPACRRRCWIDATTCAACGAHFPESDAEPDP